MIFFCFVTQKCYDFYWLLFLNDIFYFFNVEIVIPLFSLFKINSSDFEIFIRNQSLRKDHYQFFCVTKKSNLRQIFLCHKKMQQHHTVFGLSKKAVFSQIEQFLLSFRLCVLIGKVFDSIC